MNTQPPSGIAYSYIRFSSLEQAKGDSLRRQTQAAADWCARNNVRLDETTTFRDLGKSAFTGKHRENPDRNALASFLKLVESGRVPRGSFLLIENLDRLSREHIRPALTLLLNLIEAGVRVVQLLPVEAIYDDAVEPMQLMMAVMELSRGHQESAMKSQRVGAAWRTRKAATTADASILLTSRLPAWVELHFGKLRLIPHRAAVVKRAFELAVNGFGLASIVSLFTKEDVPPFTEDGHWCRAYLASILKDRRALGELQPKGRGRKPDGPPVKDYFPAVVTEDEWLRARQAAAGRRKKAGRTGDRVSLFSGLIVNARDGGSYFTTVRKAILKKDRKKDKKDRETDGVSQATLINTASAEGRTPCFSFPADPFERAILKELSEINPATITGTGPKLDATLQLSNSLADMDTHIASLEAELAKGNVAAVVRVLRSLEPKRAELATRLAEARLKAAHPQSESWGEMKSLLETLDAVPEEQRHDARLRLRSTLRQVVEQIYLLVVPRGRVRLAAVQIFFRDDGSRTYLIKYRPGEGNAAFRRAPHPVETVELKTLTAPGHDPDLRDHKAAEKLSRYLTELVL